MPARRTHTHERTHSELDGLAMQKLLHLFAVTVLLASGATAGERPNVVILVADDLGWGDVSFHGSPIKTPNLDRLTAEGVELSRFYVCPVCSPTRAGLMTGRYPIRFGLMRAVVPPWREGGLDIAKLPCPKCRTGGLASRHLWRGTSATATSNTLRRSSPIRDSGTIDYLP